MAVGASVPSSPGSSKGAGAAGRPISYTKFMLRPISGKAGFAFSDYEPDVLKRVNDQFIKTHQMPTNLQPRSKTLQANTNKNISRGFRKPKDGRK